MLVIVGTSLVFVASRYWYVNDVGLCVIIAVIRAGGQRLQHRADWARMPNALSLHRALELLVGLQSLSLHTHPTQAARLQRRERHHCCAAQQRLQLLVCEWNVAFF